MNFKALILPLSVIALFLLITFTYFSPMIQGKTLSQADMKNWHGMAKEIIDYRNSHDDENALWTNSMFGGMPSYLISVVYPNKINDFIAKALNLGNAKPASHLFLYLIGFYITLLAFGVSQRVSIIGAIAFAFSTYFLIIIEAGHVTKAIAIGYMPLIVASIYLSFNKKPVLGAILLSLFLSFQLSTRHYQITYYTLIVVAVFGLFQLIETIKSKKYKRFSQSFSYLLIGAVIALAIDLPNFYLINEYGKYSMRGKSELTANVDNKTSGLDKDYITSWSYGIPETWTFLIPNFQGGGFADDYEYTEFYKEMHPRYKQYFMQQGYPARQADQVATQQIKGAFYWGDQPFTSGPVYIGAIVIFLFVLGLFVLKGWIKWWLVSITILSLFLGWGRHFMWFTDIWLDFVPGYNKFRTVSMTLVIAEFSIPLIAFLGLDKILKGDIPEKTNAMGIRKKLMISKNYLHDVLLKSLLITGGITLFIALFGSGMFDFGQDKFKELNEMTDRIVSARQDIMSADAWRSFMFIAIAAGVMLAFSLGKVKKNALVVILGILLLFDLWPINKRYLNNDDFVKERRNVAVYEKTPVDQYILEQNEDKARVLYFPGFDVQQISTPFNDASVSYYHQSIGGYHGAKMKRYQELIDAHITNEMALLAQNFKQGVDINAIFSNLGVLNMLNTKYFIADKNKMPFENKFALGAAWFVDDVKIVANADEELEMLGSISTASTAVVDVRFEDQVKGVGNTKGVSGSIKRTHYEPNHLSYEYDISEDKIAIFSEIYYDKGWNATIDGKPAKYFRADYVLRGMKLPAGKHTVEFSFEPKGYTIGVKVTLISSLLLLLIVLAYITDQLVRKEKAIE